MKTIARFITSHAIRLTSLRRDDALPEDRPWISDVLIAQPHPEQSFIQADLDSEFPKIKDLQGQVRFEITRPAEYRDNGKARLQLYQAQIKAMAFNVKSDSVLLFNI